MLLADDSAAVQKVIELTFADEGMEVFSVGDGQAALDKLEHLTPDVVLADAFMPGLNGYELCRSMKDDNRYSKIPVMLLVSSFAPFDEAEAQRAGADDVITKPFQSIRQLVNRVDSLLSDSRAATNNSDYQVMAEVNSSQPEKSEFDESPIPVVVEHDEPHVTVLVEAAQLETTPSHEQIGGACAPDIEFQTADTARLEPEVAANQTDLYDTLEIEPPAEVAQVDAQMIDQTPPEVTSDIPMNETVSMSQPPRPRVSDALLDLDDSEFAASTFADDVVLDLDIDMPPVQERSWDLAPAQEVEAVEMDEHPVAAGAMTPEPADEPLAVSEVPSLGSENAPTGPLAYPPGVGLGQQELSADAINAIARRVIEQMSDQVVREIAWEVVPELSELLIKKKLDQN